MGTFSQQAVCVCVCERRGNLTHLRRLRRECVCDPHDELLAVPTTPPRWVGNKEKENRRSE